jgi:hypothetical protein
MASRTASRAIGDKAPPFSGEIERTKLVEYATALHLKNPVHFNKAAAVAAGYRDVVAPPGYINIFTMQTRPDKFDTFQIDERNAVAGEWGWQYFLPICAGDLLHGQSELVRLTEKQGKKTMIIMTIETRFLNHKDEVVAIHTDVTIEFKD